MPRNRLIAQIDEELANASRSLKFWRDQSMALAESRYHPTVRRELMYREAEIKRLLETQELLQEVGPEA